VNSRKVAEASAVAEEITSLGAPSITVEADVSKEGDCIQIIQEIVRHYGRIDVLVNNAGIQQQVPFEDTSIAVWHKIIEVD
jgi:glucose 1-dehydrogenase